MIGKSLLCSLAQVSLVLGVACSAQAPEELLADARSALADGELRTAEIHLKNLLQRDPDNATARALLGETLLAEGDAAGAEFNLQRAFELGTDANAIHLPLLRALLAQSKFDDMLTHIAVGPPLSGQARVELLNLGGAAYRGKRAFAEAEISYREALAIDPESLATRTELAGMYLESGRVEEARALASAVNAENPEYAPALLILGAIELASRRFPEAEARFQAAQRLEGEQSPRFLIATAQLVEAQLAQRKIAEASANTDALLALSPQNPIARYLKARVELEQNDMDAAERRLEAVIAEFPEYWPAHALLGMIDARQDQLGQAEVYLRNAVNNTPENMAARLMLAEVYLRQDDIDSARTLLASGGPGTAVSDAMLFALAGRTSLGAGEADRAAEYFDRSEASGPRSVGELIGLSSIYAGAGELDRAARVLASASPEGAENEQMVAYLLTLVQVRRGDVEAAAAAAEPLLEQAPEAAWPRTILGTIAALGGNLELAKTRYSEALALDAENVPALLGLARVAVSASQRDEAASYLQRVIDIDPQQVNAIFGMAQLAADRGEFDEAETWLMSAPESAMRWQLEGDLHAAQSEFDDAARLFWRAFDAVPSAQLAVKTYAAAARAEQPQPEAILLDWLRAHPEDVPVNFVLGSLELERSNYDAAASRFEAVIAVDPNQAAALNNLAWIYGERGDERGLDLAERAYAALPSEPSIADTLGWLHVQRGDAAAGLPFLEEAARGRPSDGEIRYHWAVALAETGDARAERILAELLNSGIAFASRPQAEERLAHLRSR